MVFNVETPAFFILHIILISLFLFSENGLADSKKILTEKKNTDDSCIIVRYSDKVMDSTPAYYPGSRMRNKKLGSQIVFPTSFVKYDENTDRFTLNVQVDGELKLVELHRKQLKIKGEDCPRNKYARSIRTNNCVKIGGGRGINSIDKQDCSKN